MTLLASLRPWLILAGACALLACDEDLTEAPTDDPTGGGGAGTTASTGSTGGGSSSSSSTGSTGGGTATGPDPLDDRGVYFYGHSLVDWGQANTQVGSAMCDVAAAQGHTCCADGEWPQGLAPSTFPYFNYPPQPGQGHQPSCWQGWSGSFEQSGVDAIVITEANFIQYMGPEDSISAASTFLATLRSADAELPVYLYEHWPEFDGDGGFDSWKNGGHAAFHDWFVALQDGIDDGGGPPVRLVPVGPLFVELLVDGGPLEDLTQADLFVDNDPHGTPTTYFISGLVHYMALYRRAPATDAAAISALPSYLHPSVRDQYPQIVAQLWQGLGSFVDGNGQSRVW